MDLFIPRRTLFLGGVALLLFGILVARWIAGWGLVTIHVKDAPLGKVIASISRQGHAQIETSLDLTKPVSLDVDRVPVVEAVEMLSIRADASWRLVYLAAPTKSDLNEALISLKGSGKLDDWTTYYYPAPFEAENSDGEVVDPRYLSLSLDGADQPLPQLLNQAAQKSGVMTAFPKDWSPKPPWIPKPNQTRRSIPALVHSVHGRSLELFLITERMRHDWRGGTQEQSSASPLEQGQSQPPVNPDWIEQRQLAQIARLPAEKQSDAKKELADRKALGADLRKLSPEERRARFLAMMSDPDRMDKMADRMLIRDSKLSAQQRITRAVNYLNRKATAIASGAAPR